MFGKVKKVFFTGVFGLMYISFVAQFVYILGWVSGVDTKLTYMALLSFEWLALISARYLSKRAASGAQHGGGFHGRRR